MYITISIILDSLQQYSQISNIISKRSGFQDVFILDTIWYAYSSFFLQSPRKEKAE